MFENGYIFIDLILVKPLFMVIDLLRIFLKVVIGRRHYNLIATKEGTVRITCEKPDLNYKSNELVKSFYSGKEGLDFYKKYFHVIPKPQHTRFKCIDQI